MLNDFYCIDAFSALSTYTSEREGMEGVIITHLLDLEKEEAIPLLLQHQFSPEGNYYFSLAIRNFDLSKTKIFENLILLFSHPFYHTHFNRKALFLYTDHPEREKWHYDLQGLLGEQLIDAYIVLLNENILSNPASGLIRINKDFIMEEKEFKDLADYYFRYCCQDYQVDDVFLVHQGSSHIAPNIEKELNTANNRLLTELPQLFSLLSQNIFLKKETLTLTHSNRLLESEKKILKELLELNSKHDEVNYILNFYKYEYEILPLWYKRLGHLIKVLTGKRTFKSLFNNKIPKYKDLHD